MRITLAPLWQSTSALRVGDHFEFFEGGTQYEYLGHGQYVETVNGSAADGPWWEYSIKVGETINITSREVT